VRWFPGRRATLPYLSSHRPPTAFTIANDPDRAVSEDLLFICPFCGKRTTPIPCRIGLQNLDDIVVSPSGHLATQPRPSVISPHCRRQPNLQACQRTHPTRPSPITTTLLDLNPDRYGTSLLPRLFQVPLSERRPLSHSSPPCRSASLTACSLRT
jgi:hypothetical protein